MRFIKKHPLLTIFLLGFLLRVGLMFLDFSYDVNNHISWAQDILRKGSVGFFEKRSTEVYASIYPNYPPLAIYIFSLFYPLQPLIFKLVWWLNINFPLFPSKIVLFVDQRIFLAAMLKLPAIMGDLGIAYVCYLFAKKIVPYHHRLPILAAILILFNPVFFYNSAYWGQIDGLPLLCVLISGYLLLFTDRYIYSAIFFTLGLLIKPTVLVYLVPYGFYFFRRFRFFKSIKAFIISNLIFWLSFLPFYRQGNIFFFPYLIYQQKILAAQSLANVSNGAFNFWNILFRFADVKDTAHSFFGISYQTLGYLLTGICFIVVIYLWIKDKNKVIGYLFANFFTAIASFLFLTKMHERYLILILPFLLLVSLKEQRYRKWYFFLSLAGFLNLYHSWSVPRIAFLVNWITTPAVYTILSALNIGVFLFLLASYAKNKAPFP